jgi:hypothetical protein
MHLGDIEASEKVPPGERAVFRFLRILQPIYEIKGHNTNIFRDRFRYMEKEPVFQKYQAKISKKTGAINS